MKCDVTFMSDNLMFAFNAIFIKSNVELNSIIFGWLWLKFLNDCFKLWHAPCGINGYVTLHFPLNMIPHHGIHH